MEEKLAINGGTPVRKNFLIFGAPQINQEEIDEVVATLKSGWIGTGPKTKQFEENFRDYIGSKYALALNSCTAGMALALKAFDIKQGDEVITTPLTFSATANVIVHQNAKPIFVDINKETLNIDPEKIQEKITEKTKAILPVHMAGRPCEMDEIMRIAEENNLHVIEDAAHAIEAIYKNKKIGNIGHVSAFSFYPTKNLTTIEGGMVTTNDKELEEKMRILSLHGISKDAWKRYTESGFKIYDTLSPGYKFNMTDIQASVGLHQLARLEENWKLRDYYFKLYNEAFTDLKGISTPIEEKNIRHARHLYTIKINPKYLKIDRNEFCAALQAENIGIGIHFISLHKSSFYKKLLNLPAGSLPNAGEVSDRILSLPISAKLTMQDVDDVIKAVKKIINHYKK